MKTRVCLKYFVNGCRLDQASFNLRKFQSNSSDLEYLINGEINHNLIATRVLGLTWGKQKDNITFLFKNLVALIYPCPGKRQLLSFVASVYDTARQKIYG